MWPGLLGGLILALPGLIPALLLNAGTDAATVRQANMIYVYERLPHHLDLWKFPLSQLVPFVVLCLLWLVLGIVVPDRLAVRRIRGFAVASLAITLLGMFFSFLSFSHPSVAAGLLRFYWFRLSDIALPLGIALLAAAGIGALRQGRPKLGRSLQWSLLVLAGLHVGDCVVMRIFSAPPHAERYWDLDAWTAACRWLGSPRRTPIPVCQPRATVWPTIRPGWTPAVGVAAGARRPRGGLPDAADVDVVQVVHGPGRGGHMEGNPPGRPGHCRVAPPHGRVLGAHSLMPGQRWIESPADLGAERLRELAAREHIDYAVAPAVPPLLLPVAYRNESYIIYRTGPLALRERVRVRGSREKAQPSP